MRVLRSRGEAMEASAEQLIRELSSEHGAALLAWAKKRCANEVDAEDLVQETLVKAWRNQHQYDPARGIQRQWIFGIARNALIDQHRASKRRLRLVSSSAETAQVTTDADLNQMVERTVIGEALSGLPDSNRQVIVASYYRGLTVREISEELKIPEGTVKSRMFYGMRALRLSLEQAEVLS